MDRWDDRYRDGDTPWDSGLPSRELKRVLHEIDPAPGRAIEFGCGTGTNAVLLAEHGFDVTAIDGSSRALAIAAEKAAAAGVDVRLVEGDVTTFEPDEPFDFVFDRGCYHCVRRENLYGFLGALRRATRPGSTYLSLIGNANEVWEGGGPPRLTAEQIARELGTSFRLRQLREIRFEDPGGVDGPLGWSALSTRRDD